LRWVSKSLEHLHQELRAQGYRIGRTQVREILTQELEYRLQAPRKTAEGGSHPDRDRQFVYIAEHVKWFQSQGWPAISVDAKKKENIGNYRTPGREYQRKGQPIHVKVYDFVDRTLGKAVPYGIYDLAANDGFVNVGVSADTAEFAVNSIRVWWTQIGLGRYPHVPALLITADGGGSNGYRVRLWKVELQKLAHDLGICIHVCHYPPGTSKWNPIEHRLFSAISKNWRGTPLSSRTVILHLIAHTTTKTGLTVQVQLDERVYQKGRIVTREELATVSIERAPFHGEWNYIIHPSQTGQKV
jgi:hypothetical protein